MPRRGIINPDNTHTILDKDHNVIPATLREWGEFFESPDRIVEQTKLNNGIWISTVFLGIDHSLIGDNTPRWFETMAFPSNRGVGELDCVRYTTWQEAEAGHAAMVKEWSGIKGLWKLLKYKLDLLKYKLNF